MSDEEPVYVPLPPPTLTLTIGPPGPPPRTWMLEGSDMESPLITWQQYPARSTRPELVAAGLDVIDNYAAMRGFDPQVLIDTLIIVDSPTPLPTRHHGHADGALVVASSARDTVTGHGRGQLAFGT